MRYLIVVIFFSSQLIAQNVKFKIDTTLTCSKQKFDSLYAPDNVIEKYSKIIIDSNNVITRIGMYRVDLYRDITFNFIKEIDLYHKSVYCYDTKSGKLVEAYFTECDIQVGIGVRFDSIKNCFVKINHDSLYSISPLQAISIFKKKFKKLITNYNLENSIDCRRTLDRFGESYYLIRINNDDLDQYSFSLDPRTKKIDLISHTQCKEIEILQARNLKYRDFIKWRPSFSKRNSRWLKLFSIISKK